MDDDEQVAARVADAAAAALQASGLVPARVVVLAVVLDGDGQDVFWTATYPDPLKVWDMLGLLHTAIARENAALAGDDDD
jgi:hypothetical protein